MAVSEVSICNNAIALLAGNRISALGDSSSKESLLCQDLYPQSRDEVIESVDWSFATARVQLAASSETPVFGGGFKTILPGETLRILGVWENPAAGRRGKYELENNSIITDFSPIYVMYIKRITDPTKFSALCIKAIYFDLAAKLCVPLTEDMKRENVLQQRAQFFLDDAAAADGVQGSQERITSDAFIRVR